MDNTVSHDANYLFYAGIKMEKVDRGEPTSPQVEKNPEVTDINRPQAWLMGNGIWMYTHYGQRIEATAVAQSRGKNLAEVWPTKEQQQKFFAAIP